MVTPFITYHMQGTFRDYEISVSSPLVPLPSSKPGERPILPDLGLLPERPLILEPTRKP